MTLGEIAESIETNFSLEQAYRRKVKTHPWLAEMLMLGYEAMCEKIKLRSDTKEYLSYDAAATIMDNVVLTISQVYDRYIENELAVNET